tara:strand:+ start:3603 stop:4898 length:1296 start_codon:yes stop_codon:yes gene_type:complete
MKNLAFFIVALVALIGTAFAVSADSPNFDINSIQVNDLDVTGFTSLDVERGDKLDIEVVVTGDVNGSEVDDVIVEAKIMGYEFGSIVDTEGPFSTEPGKTYKKTLTLYVPDDIDASEDYTLRIEVSDKVDEVQQSITLHIDEPRHNLNIFDVLLNPSSTIAAGNPVFVTVRLENLGEKEENDIKVTATISELGISTVNYIDELNTEEQEENEDTINQDNSKQLDLLLRIPEDASTGTYEVRIDVEYNRGHNFLSQSLSLNVEGTSQAGGQTVINSDSSSKAVNAGESVDYKVMVANLGDEPGVYSLQVDGVASWGESGIQPGLLTIMPDSTGEMVVSIAPFASEQAASHTWVARVMLGNEVLSEVLFTTKVNSGSAAGGDSLKSALAIIFGVLVVVLIVLALILAFRRMNSEEEDSSVAEGQAYYNYYPKN